MHLRTCYNLANSSEFFQINIQNLLLKMSKIKYDMGENSFLIALLVLNTLQSSSLLAIISLDACT